MTDALLRLRVLSVGVGNQFVREKEGRGWCWDVSGMGGFKPAPLVHVYFCRNSR